MSQYREDIEHYETIADSFHELCERVETLPPDCQHLLSVAEGCLRSIVRRLRRVENTFPRTPQDKYPPHHLRLLSTSPDR